MEDNIEEQHTQSGEEEVRLLLPGRFDFIHEDHSNLIRCSKNRFSKVHLTIGIIHNNQKNSFHTLAEKIETLQHLEHIDDIKVLTAPICDELLDELNIDFLVATDELANEWTIRQQEPVTPPPTVHPPPVSSRSLKAIVKNLALKLSRRSLDTALDAEEWLDFCRNKLQNTVTEWTQAAEAAVLRWLRRSHRSWLALYTAWKHRVWRR